MAARDVDVAGPAAAVGQISLLGAVAAQTGNNTELHLPYPVVTAAAAAADAPCGVGRRRQQSVSTHTDAAVSTTVRMDAAAAAAHASPASLLESAVSTTALLQEGRSLLMHEASIESIASSQTRIRFTSSAGSAAVSDAVARGSASSVDPAAAEALEIGGAEVTSGRGSEASRASAAPQATANINDIEAATTTQLAETANAAAGGEVSAASVDGAHTRELEYMYVGQDCFFLELPDGTLTCVAGLENLPVAPASAADANGTESHGEGAGEEQIVLARLQCHNCLQLLEFDSRAYFVQCSSCLTLNAVPNQNNSLRGGRAMIVICGRCSTRNISCLGSLYVECWQCHTVCQVDYPTPAAAGLVNGQGSPAPANAAAAVAAAAAGDIATPAGQLDFAGRGGPPGFFAGSDSRRRLQRLQRRLHGAFWRSDDEESSVSAATGGDRGTRLSTAVELPPRLWSRGRGRSLLARHSFNPLPPRNLRIHVGGPFRGTSSSTSSYREGTSLDAGTAAAQRSSLSMHLQRWRVQRLQQRQRLRWGVRPGTAPADGETAEGPRSGTGANSSRLLSLLRLPFHGKGSVAERRPPTPAALTGGCKNLRGRSLDAGGEEGEQVTKTRRTGRPGRRAPAQVFSDRSESNASVQEESDAADECAAANRAGQAFASAAERVSRRMSMRGMQATEVTLEIAETGGRFDTTRIEATNSARDGDASTEAHNGERRVNCETHQGASFANEDGVTGTAQAGACESFVPSDANASTARVRRAAVGDFAETPIDTQENIRDTAYIFSPCVTVPLPADRLGVSEERMSPASTTRALRTQPPAGGARSVSEESLAAVSAPAPVTAATPEERMPPFAVSSVSLVDARGVEENDGEVTAAGRRMSAALASDEELQTNTALNGDATPKGTDALRKSWRHGIRHWRPHERKETTRARRVKYHVGGRGTGTVP